MTLIDVALEQAGLDVVLAARRAGTEIGVSREALLGADLLLLGALADRVRHEESGDVVHVTVRAPNDEDAERGVLLVHPTEDTAAARGLALLRAVATTRLTSPRGARVAVDWSEVGLELAQVALSFGANELMGPIMSKRGLPIAHDAAKKMKGEGMVLVASLKKKEIGDLVRRMGREPVFVPAEAGEGVTA